MKDVDGATVATDKFTLYSLRENKVIASTEQDTDKWDIGFNKTTIIINGGTARKGKGAATIVKGTSFDAIKQHRKMLPLKQTAEIVETVWQLQPEQGKDGIRMIL